MNHSLELRFLYEKMHILSKFKKSKFNTYEKNISILQIENITGGIHMLKKIMRVVISMLLILTNIIYVQSSEISNIQAAEENELDFVVPEGYVSEDISGTYTSTKSITKNTILVLTGDTTIAVKSGNGIKINNGVNLYIALNGYHLKVSTIATTMAGIRVPKSSSLVVREGSAPNGTITVTGGPGTAPTAGADGTNAPVMGTPGDGGRGGKGGDAPGAAIGGDGGLGGAGGAGGISKGPLSLEVPEDGNEGSNGASGNAASGDRGTSGDVYFFGNIKVSATAGQHLSFSGTTATGGWSSGAGGIRSGGGAGGGTGGSAYGAAGIGAGGIGGGGGGGGGAGGGRWIPGNGNPDPNMYPAGGGGGGGGQSGGSGGETGKRYDIYGNPGNPGTAHAGGSGGARLSGPTGTGGPGGAGGASASIFEASNIGKVYTSAGVTMLANTTSPGSTNNSASGTVVRNNIYLLSELNVEIENAKDLEYLGTPIEPKLILKDKSGNPISSTKGTNYVVTYDKNTDAGEKTAKLTIKSSGLATDQNHLLVDGGTHTYSYTIKPNNDPILIQKTDSNREYTYGDKFQAKIVMRDNLSNYTLPNPGTVIWEGEQDDTHTGNVKGENKLTAEVYPTKVGNGNLKLKVSIVQDGAKNSNGIYNFEDLTTTFNEDIKLHKKNIEDSDIAYKALRKYLYIGAQIQPHYTVADQNEPIEFKLNSDTDHSILQEGLDFDLIYGANQDVKDGGSVTVKGIENYTGEVKHHFVIEARSVNDPDVKLDLVNPDYTGKELRPEPVLSIFGNVLPKTDYDLSWKSFKDGNATGDDLINVGKKQLNVTGKSNLSEEKNLGFEINKADIGAVNLDITPAKDVYFNGETIESRPILKYNGLLLSEDGEPVDTTQPVVNPNDFKIEFENHLEAGVANITLTGMENYKGTKLLHYNVLPRPLYIQPDIGQWKYYGAEDIFGVNQTEANPTYRTYIRALNDNKTEEMKVADATEDLKNILYVKDNLPISGYAIDLENNISREGADDWIQQDKPDTTYKYIIDDLKLSDATKNNYEVKLIDNETSYKLESYIYGGPTLSLQGTMGKNDWYVKTPASLSAPSGFTISKKNGLDINENPWNQEISYPDGDYTKDGIPYFLRVSAPGTPSNGAISKGINISFKQDTVFPTGNVLVSSDSWSSLNKDVIFDYYLNSDARGLVYAKDALSLVNTKHYYISDKKMSDDELNELEVPSSIAGGFNSLEKSNEIALAVDETKKSWIEESQFVLNINELNTQRKIIYARIEDFAGNVSYLNTDGIVFDKDAPILKAQYNENGQWTTSDKVKVKGSAFDENAGLKDRYLAYDIDGGPLQIIDVSPSVDGSFEIANLIDGNYTLTINAWDKANNAATPISFQVMKDTQMPRILLQADTTSIATKQKINFDPNVGASGSGTLEVRFNGGEWQEVAGGVHGDYYAEANGEYTFRLTNNAGVTSNESSITFTKIDNKEPAIGFSMKDGKGNNIEEHGFINSKASIVFSNTTNNLGDGKFEYSFDKVNWIEVNENLDNQAIFNIDKPEGSYVLYLRITGANGLVTTKEFAYAVDLTAPNVAGMIRVEEATGGFFRALSDFFYNKKQIVIMEAVDQGVAGAVSGVASTSHYVVKGKETLKSLPSDSKAIEAMVKEQWKDGNQVEVDLGSQYIVYYKVSDYAGNISYARSDRIVIDEAIPEIEVTYEKEGQWDNNPTMDVYVWDESPGIEGVSYQIDGQTPITAGESFTIQNLGLSDGEHIIEIHAKDKSRNTSSRSVAIKQDSGLPTIATTVATTTDKEVTIAIQADYTGPSGFDRIELSKNGQDFVDITKDIQGNHQNATYVVNENGTFIFRAYSKAGNYADATINIDHFMATKADLKAIVSAKTSDGKPYDSGTWTNQDVTVSFSNERANLKGLSYQMKDIDGNWQPVNVSNGYVMDVQTFEKTYHYEFKVILDATSEESNVVTFDVQIDKSKPTANMLIKDSSWSGSDFIQNGFLYDSYFDSGEYAIIEAVTDISGLDHYEIFTIREAEIPEAIKGTTTASKIESLGNGRWQRSDRLYMSPNDSYVAFGKVIDRAGNITYVSSNGVVFDDVNPSITTDLDQEGWYKDDTTEIHFQTNDNLATVKEVTYEINGGITQAANLSFGAFTLSSGVFINGENTINIHVLDKAGNIQNEQFIVKKDSEAPTINVVDNSAIDKLYTKTILDVQASAGASEIAKVEVKSPDAGGWTDITNTYTSGYIAEENGLYWFRVVSGSGVFAVQNITIGNISKDIPVITYIMSNSDGSTYLEGEWKKDLVSVQFTNANANQVVGKYMYKIDDGAYKECSEEKNNSAIFTSEKGEHRYTLKLILENGLESEETSVVIKIDDKAPRIQVNSDLSQWVKEDQEVEVEVVDDESGVDVNGYSFDSGNHWQSSNKATIRVNKLVGIRAKDLVANTADTKVLVDKIDSQGPSVKEFKQLGEEASRIRDLQANIEDYCDLTGRSGSGIAQAFIMTSYPYKDGEFEANPDKTYQLQEKNNTWMTDRAISVPYDGENDVWLVTEDNVGNMKIYSTKVTNMIGIGDDEGNTDKPDPEDPTTPDKPENGEDPIQPIEPSKPDDGQGSGSQVEQEKPNTGGQDVTTSPESSLDQKISYRDILIEHKVNKEEKVAEGLTTTDEDVKHLKELQETLAKNEAEVENEEITVLEKAVRYVIPWILLIVVGAWIVYLRRKYTNTRKALEEKKKEG